MTAMTTNTMIIAPSVTPTRRSLRSSFCMPRPYPNGDVDSPEARAATRPVG